MTNPMPRGRRWENFARFAVQHYGGLCHICLAATEEPGKLIT